MFGLIASAGILLSIGLFLIFVSIFSEKPNSKLYRFASDFVRKNDRQTTLKRDGYVVAALGIFFLLTILISYYESKRLPPLIKTPIEAQYEKP